MFLAQILLVSPSGAQDGLVDVTESLGVDFEHRDGRTGKKRFVETVGSGGGWIDIDSDGDIDLYLVNGGGAANRLFENRDGGLVDVTQKRGVEENAAYGMGLCAGDANGDGFVDLLVTNVGPNSLLVNDDPTQASSKYHDRARSAGVAGDDWSVSCAFGDLDGDLDLDLYVVNYVEYSLESDTGCVDKARDLTFHCHPDHFRGAHDALLINRGDGTFTSEGRERGIAVGVAERGLGVVLSDLDNDGDLDIYVSNDGAANRLYRNRGDATFEDLSLLSGAALSESGAEQAGMGVAAGDVDGDGLIDLSVTNFSLEANNLYVNRGEMSFEDLAPARGVASVSLEDLGWGHQLVDIDIDGDLDLVTVNGHVMDNIEHFVPGLTYEQPDRLLLNDGAGGFLVAPPTMRGALEVASVSRGLAVGDFDSDGRPDLLVTTQNGPARILANRITPQGSWLGVRLVGRAPNVEATGARVVLEAGGRRQLREVRSGGGVLVQNDPRLLFGVPDSSAGSPVLTVRWPDGQTSSRSIQALDRYVVLRREEADDGRSSPASNER